jgi:predicted DNA-binding transcriptional regulator AlpA
MSHNDFKLSDQSVAEALKRMDEKLVRHTEAAEILSVSPRTIREWTSLRKIPHRRITPRCVRYSVPELLEWAEENRIDVSR